MAGGQVHRTRSQPWFRRGQQRRDSGDARRVDPTAQQRHGRPCQSARHVDCAPRRSPVGRGGRAPIDRPQWAGRTLLWTSNVAARRTPSEGGRRTLRPRDRSDCGMGRATDETGTVQSAGTPKCAATLDRIGAVPGTKGIMLIFPECVQALQEFGERVLPLMRTAKLEPPRLPRIQV